MQFPSLLVQAGATNAFLFSELSAATVFYSRPATPNPRLTMQIASRMNSTHNVIPGGSPFFYMEDPARNHFTISSISMTPTPCQIGLPCAIETRGTFHEGLPFIELSFDVEARLKDGQSAKIIAVNDSLCDWATVEQEGRASCPPRKGEATISTGLELAPGWVMEATYFIDLRLTLGKEILTHIGARIVLTNPDNDSDLPNTTTS